MDVIELKFLLTLLGYRPDYRAPLSKLSLTAQAADRNRACRQLRDRGFINCLQEIVRFKTTPPGSALLKLDIDHLPITSSERAVLQAGVTGYVTPATVKRIPAKKRQVVLQALAEQGLIQTETRIKEVWITAAGATYLRDDYIPQGQTPISLTLWGYYLQFLRHECSLIQSRHQTDVSKAHEMPITVSASPTDAEILELIRTLDHELGTENYLPIFYLRRKLQPPLTRDELDQALYRLQRQDQIDFSSLQESAEYTSDQIHAGIPQDLGGPLFFISVIL